MHRSARNAVILALLTVCAAQARAAAPPVAVSPGGATSTAIADRCPTFDWAGVAGAEGYELVVYRVGDGDVAADPVLTQRVPGAAFGWSPALDRCLERGVPYAWSVRAIPGEASSSWAEPLFFEIAASPPADELAAALEVVRRHLAVEGGSARNGTPLEAWERSRTLRFRASAPAAGKVGLRPAPGRDVPSKVSSAAVGNPGATMSVRGEVRTIDSQGEPRLWGRGRPGMFVYGRAGIGGGYCEATVGGEGGGAALILEYGLSEVMVDWGSAADACPAGTWVCSESVLEDDSCDTSRPNFSERLDCSGDEVDLPDHDNEGWIADSGSSTEFSGGIFSEFGNFNNIDTCNTLPVWCCW